jgi:hypothetical protein
VDLDTHGIKDSQLLALLDSMKQVMSQTIAPLPVEAMGVGGRWQVVSLIEQFGMTVTQRETYTVANLADRDVHVTMQVEQSAPPGKVALPGLPAGVTVDLVKLSGSGSGSSQIEFSGFVPQSNLDYELAMKITVPGMPGPAGGSQTLDLKMATSLVLQPQE